MEKSELEKNVALSHSFFYTQLTVLKMIVNRDLTGKAGEVKILLASTCGTGTAICKLSDEEGLRYFYTELMMLARSFIEKLTNFCYLQVCEPKEFSRFLLHPLYRIYHNFDRTKQTKDKVINLKFIGKDSYGELPSTKEALDLFSPTNPRMNWSDKSIDSKVGLIGEKMPIKVELFLMNTLSVYSNASEALHGSLYGCSFHMGAYAPGYEEDPVKIEAEVLKNAALLFIQLGSMINEVIKYLNTNHALQDALAISEKNMGLAVACLKNIFGEALEEGIQEPSANQNDSLN